MSGMPTITIMATMTMTALRRFRACRRVLVAGGTMRYTPYRAITTVPVPRMAATLVTKSSSAPADWPSSPASSVEPGDRQRRHE